MQTKVVLVQLALPYPTTPDAASRPTTTLLYQWPPRCSARPRLPASIYGYGATLNTRPRPALFTLLVVPPGLVLPGLPAERQHAIPTAPSALARIGYLSPSHPRE